MNVTGMQPMRLPDPTNRAGTDTSRSRHQVGGPMGGLGRRIRPRQRDHRLGHFGAEPGDVRGPRLVAQQAIDAFAE